jgi:hypothetical protein
MTTLRFVVRRRIHTQTTLDLRCQRPWPGAISSAPRRAGKGRGARTRALQEQIRSHCLTIASRR